MQYVFINELSQIVLTKLTLQVTTLIGTAPRDLSTPYHVGKHRAPPSYAGGNVRDDLTPGQHEAAGDHDQWRSSRGISAYGPLRLLRRWNMSNLGCFYLSMPLRVQ